VADDRVRRVAERSACQLGGEGCGKAGELLAEGSVVIEVRRQRSLVKPQ
jgi:hypothetical protein